MKQRLLRLTAMLMFGCMVASSIPTGTVLAEENAQSADSAGTVQEQTETPDAETEDPAQSSGQSDSTGAAAQDGETEGAADAGENSDVRTGDGAASAEDSAVDENGTSDEDTQESTSSQKSAEAQAQEGSEEGQEPESDAASQEDSVIEKNADEINYVFVESPYLETPGTERIAVSYGDGSETVSDASLTVRDDAGQEAEWELSVSAGQVYLFTYDFADESSTGTYEVVSLNVTDEEGEKTIQLSDSGMEAYFGVNEEYDGIEELQPLDAADAETASSEESAEVGATVAEIDPSNVEESAEQIVDALEEAEDQTDTSDLSASLEGSTSMSGRTASKAVSVSAASLAAVLGTKIQTVAATKAKSGNGNVVVALDPGHDSKHTGASYGNLREEELTLKIAQYCKAELETYSGVTVYMTRTSAACPYPNNSSSGGDIGDRVIAAADAGADIFVSFHLNSSTASGANGAEVIIPNSNWKPQVAQEGKELAQAILKELQGVGLNLRPTEIYSKDTTIGEKYPDGSLSDYFSVQIYAKEAGIPGIIVEHAFLTNSGDRAHLDSEADLKELGVADATGIAKYLGLSKGDWRTEGGKTYFYQNGKKVTGEKKISGYWYYFDPRNGGAMYTGWRQDGSKKYYYDTDGKLALGKKKISGYWYYFKNDGNMYTGWRQDGSKRYYYDTDGRLTLGKKKISGFWYYFKNDGNMHTGWRQDGSKRYYYDTNGKLILGKKKIGGYWYYFNTDGNMHTGWRQDGSKRYYYDTDGKLALGKKKISGYWYYFKNDGNMYTGWRQDGAKRYYYDTDGKLALGKKKISGSWYYFKNDGNMYTGWRQDGAKKYYYGSDGKLFLGKKQINGSWYYFKNDGNMCVGWYQNGSKRYYCDANGILALGKKKISGSWYYFNTDGSMHVGWRQDGAKRYYYGTDGKLALGKKKINGSWYYFKHDGNMYTGWRDDGSYRYYYKSDGKLALGETVIGSATYYFQSNGNLLKSGFANRKYYGANGVLIPVSSYGSVFYKIEGSSTTTVDQMVRFYKASGNTYPSEALGKGGASTIEELAKIFYEEASAEGIKAEVLWAQTMHETGYLKFGGQVKIEQFNFAGLGATDGGAAGASFKDVRTGVRAQVQHMKAYASTASLKNACVDPRFNLVKRGSAQYVEILGQKENPTGAGWATNSNYGLSLVELIKKVKSA